MLLENRKKLEDLQLSDFNTYPEGHLKGGVSWTSYLNKTEHHTCLQFKTVDELKMFTTILKNLSTTRQIKIFTLSIVLDRKKTIYHWKRLKAKEIE